MLQQFLAQRGQDHILFPWQAENFAAVGITFQKEPDQLVEAVYDRIHPVVRVLFKLGESKKIGWPLQRPFFAGLAAAAFVLYNQYTDTA